MKLTRKLVAVCACFVLAAGVACAFGKDGIGMYGKGAVGYSFYAPEKDDIYFESNCVEITPTFGIFPIAGNKNFALEASLDMNFGGKDDVSTRVFAPQVMAIFYTPLTDVLQGVSLPDFLKKLTPYWGLGFSLPIETVEIFIFSETDVKFRMNLSAGAKYDITDKIAATLDFNAGLFNSWAWSIRAGAIYTIK